ncbi:hypothetical protein LXA43DRAFT_662250 [Ganoderma leucocontextum]|nr:hypothetical protein LXA43DRAFT_662250 [Ganoderma leucocontextum]
MVLFTRDAPMYRVMCLWGISRGVLLTFKLPVLASTPNCSCHSSCVLPSAARRRACKQMDSARVYLGGVPDSLSGEDIYKHLSVYGRITEIKLRPGFGFVQFESQKDALDVVRTFSGRSFLGTDIKMQLARPDRFHRYPEEPGSPPYQRASEGRKRRYAVVVKGLNPRTCWQELKDFGRSIGCEVAYCDVDREHRTRGFINYFLEEDAERAVRKLDGIELLGSVVRVQRQHTSSGGHSPERARTARSRSPSRPTQDPDMGYIHDQGESSSYRVHSDPRESNEASRDRAFSGSSDILPYTPSVGALFPDRTLPHEYAMTSQNSHAWDKGTTSSWHFR